MSCLALKMTQLALAAFTFKVRDPSLDVIFAAGEHGVDEAGELVGSGFDSTRAIEASQTCGMDESKDRQENRPLCADGGNMGVVVVRVVVGASAVELRSERCEFVESRR